MGNTFEKLLQVTGTVGQKRQIGSQKSKNYIASKQTRNNKNKQTIYRMHETNSQQLI